MSVQNAAARFITGARKYDHTFPVLRDLHWLPLRQRIIFNYRHFDAPVFERFAHPNYLATDLVSQSLVDAWPETVATCSIRTAIHSNFQEPRFMTYGPEGRSRSEWSHKLK